ncbi:hypothetical protein [Paraherbaspirillum soli]|uniref:Uncharacterized protein n=1 Tax=Paraherbaspirillum soli TaxID=631222 RepID=A0ABW0M2U4_9BURK
MKLKRDDIVALLILGAIAWGSYWAYTEVLYPTPRISAGATAIIITGKERERKVYGDDNGIKILYSLEVGDRCQIDYTRSGAGKTRMFPISCENKDIGWSFVLNFNDYQRSQ